MQFHKFKIHFKNPARKVLRKIRPHKESEAKIEKIKTENDFRS